ncbi:EF-hand domain-containing protein [Tabrizicola sp.]|uniref:EF-hand domain-containing protein n=1 Tax=Tabrizicola sp. TaxID=2005166 RepID=UPI002736E3C3|nr:EF-hand domain-containing protein [Tabrizicola sp.]MDP3195018.1 EF-hand domain-containing protein [Tabrizicola sp.]
MSASKKTVFVTLALTGALIGSVALAQNKGMGGGMGVEGRGAMLTEMFDAIDADSDGKVTLAELEAHRKAEFAAADTNGDGALSPEELSAHQMARIQARMAERTQAMIDNMDNDGNGSLSEDEMGQGPGERHFARLDTDNDGAISKAEAEEARQHRGKRGHGGGMGNN